MGPPLRPCCGVSPNGLHPQPLQRRACRSSEGRAGPEERSVPTVVLDDKEPDEETRRRDRQQKGGPVGVVQAAQHRGPDEHEEDRSGEHLRDTPFQDGFRVGREDIGRASRSALGARPRATCTAAPMLPGCIMMMLRHQTENTRDRAWISAGRSRPRPGSCRAVIFVRSAVRRNPHRTDSALVSALHVPLHDTA